MHTKIIAIFTSLCLSQTSFATCPSLTTLNNSETIEVKEYIDKNWQTLTRSLANLPESAADPKIDHAAGEPWIVYIARSEDKQAVEDKLMKILSKEQLKTISIEYLPADINNIKNHGLLYVPEPYVVPGSRFNELYAWDSYFIELGLLADNKIKLTQSIINNFIYEIEQYGKILNGNRTYYLTRSQPPLFSQMVMALFKKTNDIEVIKSALPAMIKYYAYWDVAPRKIPEIGLTRYYPEGQGPAYEVYASKNKTEGMHYYQNIKDFYAKDSTHAYNVRKFYNAAENKLTPLFYIGDRAVRESGYDTTNRYGPFSANITDYASVTLNVLLYQYEKDIATAFKLTNDKVNAKKWLNKAEDRKAKINRYLWNEDLGLYLPYNFKTKQSSPYIFADTFIPLWAKIASKQQAAKVINYLNILLKPGGLLTSTYFTGNQWDAPFVWAPLQLFAAVGLQNYEYQDLAKQVKRGFIQNINYNFQKHHALYEKYNALDCEVQTDKSIKFGYSENQIGFGWTNGVYLHFLQD